MTFFVHPSGICESTQVGQGTRIWAFAHVLPGARIGSDSNICDHVFIENDVVVGNRVTIKSGVQLWDGVRLADDVFVGPNVSFTNDRFPRSKKYPDRFAPTEVSEGASIGAGAVILPGIRIGRCAFVGAGAVVTRNVPPNAIVVGNPARIAGYVDSRTTQSDALAEAATPPPPLPESRIPGVRLEPLRHAVDLRGSLVAADFDSLPFLPRRFFTVFDVPTKDVRGEHAHKECGQLLICVRGSVRCIVDDGTQRDEFVLDRGDRGLLVPPMVWGTQYDYSADACLLVLASLPYDPDDYIRDYDEYLSVKLG